MDPAAIKSVLASARTDIQDQMKRHNKDAQDLMRSPLGKSMSGFGMGTLSPIADRGVPQGAVDELMKNPTPAMMKHFDDAFKQPGMAARMVDQYGGTPTGAAPLAPGGR